MTFTRRIQLLWCVVEIETDDEAVHEQLAYMDHAAEHVMAAMSSVRLSATRSQEGYELARDAVPFATASSPRDVLEVLFRTAYLAAFAAMPAEAIVFHGVTVAADDGRMLLVAPSGSGKSTLAAHLSSRGRDVLGDEYAVLVDGRVTALPRRFHVKAGSFEHLADMEDVLAASPFVDHDVAGGARSFDPADLGRPRKIDSAPLRSVVEIVANHGGDTRLEPIAQVDMAMRLMAQTFVPDGPPGAWIDRLCRALRDATTHRLLLGDVQSAFIALSPLLG